MKTNELIDDLSHTLAPVSAHAVPTQLATGIGAGAAISFLAMWAWLGIRPDLAAASATFAFWMKFAFTLALTVLALWATGRLARPAGRAAAPFAGIAAVFLALLAVALVEWSDTPPAGHMHLVMGSSSHVCPWRIALLSLPIFAGAFWSMHRLAPTRLVPAGTIAGFAAGALGAWIYAFHCDESAAPFVLVFYTFGIALIGAAGAALARPLLRW